MPRRRHALHILDDRAALVPGSYWWAYCRVSLGERQDIASQRRAVQEFADKHQIVIARWWIDDHVSGSSVEGREAFDAMAQTARREASQVAGILVWNLSRWARNDLESQLYRADLRLHGYAVVSVADDIPGGDISLLVEAFIDLKNRKFLEDLSKDTRRGLRDTVLREVEYDGRKVTGFSGGGFPPRGYKAKRIETGRRRNGEPRINAVWEIDPDWQERVTRARQMYAAGELTSAIHAECKLFKTLGCYHTWWGNETYAGVRRCGEVRVLGAHPAYDSPEQRAAILARLAQNANRHAPRPSSRHAQMLSGLIVCGHCGAPWHAHAHAKGDHYFCSQAHRRDSPCKEKRVLCRALDAAIINALREKVFTPPALRAIVDHLNAERLKQQPESAKEKARLERERRKVMREVDNLVGYIAAGNVSRAVSATIRDKEKAVAELDARLDLLELQSRTQLQILLSERELQEAVDSAIALLDSDNAEKVWALVRAFVERVTISDGHVEITPTLSLQALDYQLGEYPQPAALPTGTLRLESSCCYPRGRLPGPRPVTPKQLRVVAMRSEGLRLREIGERIGVSPQAVSEMLRRARG